MLRDFHRRRAELLWQAGAVAVAGCCTTVADHIRQVVAARRTYTGKR